ncbi:hypothetical protein ACDX78_06190 [Virgibacillus oceani]
MLILARKRKLGWFVWTLIIVLTVTVIGSAAIFFNLFNLDINDILNRQASTVNEEITEETQQEIEEIQETVGQEHSEIGEFITNQHEFYNETTGYGGINNLDWVEQTEIAREIMDYINEQNDAIVNEALRHDLNIIHNLASDVVEKEDQELVRDLHRYFHDLDIALNGYTEYDRIWNVTETLGSSN